MKLQSNHKGYLRVILKSNDNQKSRNFRVHRLVACHFLAANQNEELQVNHINGIKTDNRVINLEWVTCSENQIHYRTYLKPPTLGA
jgi:hypothetical protein